MSSKQLDFMRELEGVFGSSKQEVIGEKLGLSQSMISNIYNGKRPSIKTARKIASSLNRPRKDVLPRLGHDLEDSDLLFDLREFGIAESNPSERKEGDTASLPDTEDSMALLSEDERALFRSLQRLGHVVIDRTPIIGRVPCSDPDRRYEEDLGTVGEYFGALFSLIVEGDSMEPDYYQGDVLGVRVEKNPPIGKHVVAVVYGDSVCKKLTGAETDTETGEAVYTLTPTSGKHRTIKASDIQFQGIVVSFTRRV